MPDSNITEVVAMTGAILSGRLPMVGILWPEVELPIVMGFMILPFTNWIVMVTNRVI